MFDRSLRILLFPGVLKQVVDKCVVGASVREICEFGDALLTEETSKVFKKEKELKKGKPPTHWCIVFCRTFCKKVIIGVFLYSSQGYDLCFCVCR
jgi:hypothetical protein